MPAETWTPGQVLTAAELTILTNLLPYPTVTSVGVNPCVAGTFYRCTNSSPITMTLPVPSIGQTIGFKLDSASPGTVTVSQNAAELLYGLTGVRTSRGVASMALTMPDQVLVLTSDGTNWHEVDNGSTPGLSAKGALVATSETTSNAAYVDLTTPGPAVTMVTGSQALVTLSAQFQNGTANGSSAMSVAVSGATTIAASDTVAIWFSGGAATNVLFARFGDTFIVTGLTPGANIFTAKYKCPGGTGFANFVNRRIVVQP